MLRPCNSFTLTRIRVSRGGTWGSLAPDSFISEPKFRTCCFRTRKGYAINEPHAALMIEVDPIRLYTKISGHCSLRWLSASHAGLVCTGRYGLDRRTSPVATRYLRIHICLGKGKRPVSYTRFHYCNTPHEMGAMPGCPG